MKKILSLSIVLLFSFQFAAFAQIPDVSGAASALGGNLNIGSLLTQFAGGLKPASMISSWAAAKSGWLGKAGKVTDAAGVSSSLSSLTKFIKPGMFSSGFNLQSLLAQAKTAKTVSDGAGALKNLEGGLKPEAYTDDFKSKKSTFESALGMLK